MHNTSSKVLWWKWKKDKLDAIQQESERLTLELCLMTMILNVDLLCRVRMRTNTDSFNIREYLGTKFT